jgi:tryptophan 2,3-dioxygenase
MKSHAEEAKPSGDAAAGGGCPMGHGGAAGAEGVPGDGGKGAPVYYHSYLQLDKILGAQRPLSATAEKPEGEHDEMLFLIIHQTFELWFKQVLHEVSAVITIFSKDYVEDTESARCLHHLGRVCAILRLAVSQFDVLETLTPVDFMSFRDALFPASGFQSVQFRILENRLGMDPTKRIQYQVSTRDDR